MSDQTSLFFLRLSGEKRLKDFLTDCSLIKKQEKADG